VSQELHNQASQGQIEVNPTEAKREESPTKKHNTDLHQTWERRRFITAKPLFIGSVPIAAAMFFRKLKSKENRQNQGWSRQENSRVLPRETRSDWEGEAQEVRDCQLCFRARYLKKAHLCAPTDCSSVSQFLWR